MVLSFPPSPKSDTPLPPLEEEKLFSKVKIKKKKLLGSFGGLL
jgi:hypothetical protein